MKDTSPRYAAELKSVIEGVKDGEFWDYRQATEDEPKRDYNRHTHLHHNELDEEIVSAGSEVWMSPDEDEDEDEDGDEGVDGMEGVERN